MLRWLGIEPHIPKQEDALRKQAVEARWVVEEAVLWLKGLGRMRVRCDRLGVIMNTWTTLTASASASASSPSPVCVAPGPVLVGSSSRQVPTQGWRRSRRRPRVDRSGQRPAALVHQVAGWPDGPEFQLNALLPEGTKLSARWDLGCRIWTRRPATTSQKRGRWPSHRTTSLLRGTTPCRCRPPTTFRTGHALLCRL